MPLTTSRSRNGLAGAPRANSAGISRPVTASASEVACTEADARVECLLLVLQPAQEERQPEDQQEVPEDRAGERCLHDLDLVVQDQEDRDDQLGDVAERGVDQPADPRPGVQRELFGGTPDQPGERQDRGRRRQRRSRAPGRSTSSSTIATGTSDQEPVERGLRTCTSGQRRGLAEGLGELADRVRAAHRWRCRRPRAPPGARPRRAPRT